MKAVGIATYSPTDLRAGLVYAYEKTPMLKSNAAGKFLASKLVD
jgi:hypothetical protein